MVMKKQRAGKSEMQRKKNASFASFSRIINNLQTDGDVVIDREANGYIHIDTTRQGQSRVSRSSQIESL